MTPVMSQTLLKALLCAWLLACVVATLVNSDLVFAFAYFVLPASSLVVPVLVAVLTIQMRRARPSLKLHEPSRSIAAEFTSFAVVPIAYLMSAAVIARLLEIPWRRAKFGGEALDLGLSAAGVFSFAAVAVTSAALILLRRLQPSSPPWAPPHLER